MDGKVSYDEFPDPDWHRANLNGDEFLSWEEELINRAMRYLSADYYLEKYGEEKCPSRKPAWTSQYAWNKDRPDFVWAFPFLDRNYDGMITAGEYEAFINQKKKYNEPE